MPVFKITNNISNNSNNLNTNNQNIYSPQEIAGLILSKLKSDAESYLKKEIKKAVITVPAYFNNFQRKSTFEAGKLAKLEVIRIINEPTAAGLAYKLINKIQMSKGILLFLI